MKKNPILLPYVRVCVFGFKMKREKNRFTETEKVSEEIYDPIHTHTHTKKIHSARYAKDDDDDDDNHSQGSIHYLFPFSFFRILSFFLL